MLKYLVLFALLVSAVNCNEGGNPAGPETSGEAPPVPPQPSGPNRMGQLKNLGTGLFDLGVITSKHLSNLGKEAMPLIDKAGKSLSNEAVGLAKNFRSSEFAQGTLKAIDEHPTARRFKPYANTLTSGLLKLKEQGVQRLKPLVQDGIKAANPVIDQVNANRHKLMAGHNERMSKLNSEYRKQPPSAPEGGAEPQGPQ